ncbi:MAG: helix-turn-helix transcriptional regulator [Bacteroidales bacterium]|nr:helix-turn-helix transcriptional regulator [Bacteroidales bacterium]
MNHNSLKEKALLRKGVNAEYKSLEPEFTLLREMLLARQSAGLSQAQIAERMGTKPPAITRLESSLTSGKHSPSLATIKKYAEAVGYNLEIRLVHK